VRLEGLGRFIKLIRLIGSRTHELPTCRMASSGMLRRVALVRTDVSEEPSASFIRMTRIGELGTTRRASVASYS
jgi:hypothetical protein